MSFCVVDMLQRATMTHSLFRPLFIGRLCSLATTSWPDLGLTLKGYGVSLLHQSGRKGHCSVEDALAALHIYKLVENEMESELWSKTSKREELPQPGPVSIDHYMQDQYWPEHLTDDSQ